MTIKKPMNTAATPAAPTSGGAAIASRLRLDVPDPSAKSAPTGGLKAAFGAALVALIVSGILTYLLWSHWDYLKSVCMS